MNIQWYPGHMTKAKRMMEENIKLIDCVIELVDARAPISSQNPDLPKIAKDKPRLIILTKMDLADEREIDRWIDYYTAKNSAALAVNARDGQNMNKVIPLLKQVCQERIERNIRRGLINKPLRVMVAGIPNVGKSTFINKIVGKASAKTGNKPGVTKGKQWIKLKKGIELLDTPGILWPKFEDKTTGLHLAFIGSINDNILDTVSLAYQLVDLLNRKYPTALAAYYPNVRFYEQNQPLSAEQIVVAIANDRNFRMEQAKPDIDRTCKAIIDEYRKGSYGRLTIDQLP